MNSVNFLNSHLIRHVMVKCNHTTNHTLHFCSPPPQPVYPCTLRIAPQFWPCPLWAKPAQRLSHFGAFTTTNNEQEHLWTRHYVILGHYVIHSSTSFSTDSNYLRLDHCSLIPPGCEDNISTPDTTWMWGQHLNTRYHLDVRTTSQHQIPPGCQDNISTPDTTWMSGHLNTRQMLLQHHTKVVSM